MVKTWLAPGVKQHHIRKYRRSKKWLVPDKLDSSFGLHPTTPDPAELCKIELARSYRRVQSSRMFRTMAPHDVSLHDLPGFGNQQSGDYVVIEKSQLSNISQLEEALRKEQLSLGEQCTWLACEKCRLHYSDTHTH